MPALSPERRRAAARVAGLHKSRGPDDPDLSVARRELAVESLAEHIRHVVDQAPPLTDEQRNRIAALLRPTRKAGNTGPDAA